MTTRWQELRKNLEKLVNQDKITPKNIELLEEIRKAAEFSCSKCKYLSIEHQRFLCDGKDVTCCRNGFADYLNEEVTETKNIKKQ